MYKNPSFMSVRIAPGLKKIRTDELRASVPPTVKEKHLAIYGAQKIAFVLDCLILFPKTFCEIFDFKKSSRMN